MQEPSGQRCGFVPSLKAGTTNFWSHLWNHHRQDWYELKQQDGKLNAVGEEALRKLKEALTQQPLCQLNPSGGSQLKSTLALDVKATLDRIVKSGWWMMICLSPPLAHNLSNG